MTKKVPTYSRTVVDIVLRQVDHYREAEEWQRKQAGAAADLLMEIIIAVDPPMVPPDYQGDRLFGAYSPADLLERIRGLASKP